MTLDLEAIKARLDSEPSAIVTDYWRAQINELVAALEAAEADADRLAEVVRRLPGMWLPAEDEEAQAALDAHDARRQP